MLYKQRKKLNQDMNESILLGRCFTKPNTIALAEKLITSYIIFPIVNLPKSHGSLKLT